MDVGVPSQTHIFLWEEVKEGAGIEIHFYLPAGSGEKQQLQCP